MGNLLYLVHRLPFPPNKGDKVRSYHLLKHLAMKHSVFLGTFVDDPEDEKYVDYVRSLCADMHLVRLSPRVSRLRSLSGLLSRQALTLTYYRDAGLLAWVAKMQALNKIDAVVAFSSAMAQYTHGSAGSPGVPTLIDFVDVDSAKWTEFASAHRWPLSWLYRREGKLLLAYEREMASRAKRSFFVTDKETSLFRQLAPECSGGVESMSNGVDSEYFLPSVERASPFSRDEVALVFTGAMDYWPNIDAVTWFANEIFPLLRPKWPQLRFYIVGSNPASSVRTLASDAVIVTGTVPDVRPYLQHAAAVVAPLRVARGIQNKILEAMAMGRPVVASRSCAQAIDVEVGSVLLSALDVDDFVHHIDALLQHPEQAHALGQAGRQSLVKRYSWAAHLSVIDRHLPSCQSEGVV